ncbi:MAG: hypothetical protein QM611_03960 [Microbacterium sp.]|uniref:hypothetical protein n=1 Tax=Microbacterium sp. TaxID=51671 RepID=UPI0039E52120
MNIKNLLSLFTSDTTPASSEAAADTHTRQNAASPTGVLGTATGTIAAWAGAAPQNF